MSGDGTEAGSVESVEIAAATEIDTATETAAGSGGIATTETGGRNTRTPHLSSITIYFHL